MQFHLNGFQAGDPLRHSTPQSSADVSPRSLPDLLDVLIVGGGPTGLTLAAQLAAFPEISTRIVEQKAERLLLGQADGIACRTMEMFEAFGFSERVLKESYWVNETAFWKPDPEQRDKIVRSDRIQDTEDGLSEFPHVILNQARVHDFFLDLMRDSPGPLEPDYSCRFLDLRVSADPSEAYPVTVRLERLDPQHRGQVETVRARYVVGCDGARSAVRAAIGKTLQGESANQAWGVMDVLAVTDFPDVRLKAVIQSAEAGNVLIIPREGGYLVRLYVELDELESNERVSSRAITADRLVLAAQRILHPYTLEVKEVAWWSVYEIGQRLCDQFDDAPDSPRGAPRVFIAGDACHTHSPKAGQGMNMSMADGFNLGWKLASVLLGRSSPDLLRTYSDERRAVAEELIDFDRAFAQMFSASPRDPADPESQGVDPAAFQAYFVKQGRFTAGTAVSYGPSLITTMGEHQSLAEGLPIGMRFHSAPVIRLADAKPVQLGHAIKADGRWRLFAFAPAEDPALPSSRLQTLCTFLDEAVDSPIKRYTPSGADVDAVIDFRAILQQAHRVIALEAMPPLLRPRKGRYGLIDYEKLYCPDLKGGADIFDLRLIDRTEGCLVVVRPDQYVAGILPFDQPAALTSFFDRFMLRAS